MKLKAISRGVAVSLGLLPMAVLAQSQAENNTEAAEEEVELIEVTGSRIKRVDMETISPVVVISAADIQMQGHANVYDALNSLSMNTGIFVGEENTNNFNANAQALNLRGFGSGYTLTLLNGRRIPVLPKPSGSVAGNVVNLAMIPTEAVKRVEVLSGGASAIYGSDAVAGVINIILKDDVDYNQVTARYGDTKDGGGESKKFTFSTGGSIDDFSYSAVVEVDQRDPIYGNQRDWFDHPTDGPDPTRHDLSQVMSYWQSYPSWKLADISDRCAEQGYEKGQPSSFTPLVPDTDPHYCGDNVYGTYTIRNQRDRASAFINMEYELDDAKLFATLIGTQSEADAGLYRYSYRINYETFEGLDDINNLDWSKNLGARHVYRQFRDFETPTTNQEFEEQTLMGIFGIEGTFGDDYDYSVTVTASQYDYEDSVVRFRDEEMRSILFGEKGVDWADPWPNSGWVVVRAETLNDDLTPGQIDFFGDITPDMFEGATHTSIGKGESYLYSLQFDLSGSLMELPAGDVMFAVVAEAMREGYKFDTDDDTVTGAIHGWSGIIGSGDRNRYSVGGELLIPLTEEDSAIGLVEAKLAGRYDYYDDESDVDGAFTYQAGLTWQPFEELLVRSSYSTSFRAPDMHYMYAEESSSFTNPIDYLACVQTENLQAGESWSSCGDEYSRSGIRQYSVGDIDLEEETGDSFSFGFVMDITDNLSMTLDYYDISLEKKVSVLSASSIIRFETECTVGFTQFGETVDPNSAKCQDMLSRVSRNPNRGNSITETRTSPFNTGIRQQKGMDFSARYNKDLEDFGNVFFSINYTHIFQTNVKFLDEDIVEDIRDRKWNDEFRTHTTATLGWYNDDLSVSLFGNRLGSSPIPGAQEYERYDAWTRYNLNVSYYITEDLKVDASVVNLFDKKPPQHETEIYWPFADISKYNAVGMEYYITVGYQF